MGTLSNLLEFEPFDMVPPGVVNNPQTFVEFRAAKPYASPEHFTFFAPKGPWSVGNYDTFSIYGGRNGQYLAGLQDYFDSNAQIVTVPDRPVDQGTYLALLQKPQPANGGQPNYATPPRGTALQPRLALDGTVTSGSAPTQGVYTGYHTGNSWGNASMTGDEGV